MIAEFREAGYQIPPRLRDVLVTDPNTDDWATFGAAVQYVRAGIPVLPCKPNSKEPLGTGPFRHGSKSATTDYETVRDTFLSQPDANVALAPGPDWVILDIDPRNGGSLERAEQMGIDIHGYRERTPSGGWHIPLAMPTGESARKSAILAPGIEVKGPRSYVVSPHSRLDRLWYRVDDRDVWRWGELHLPPSLMSQVTGNSIERTRSSEITNEDHIKALELKSRLLSGRYKDGIKALWTGDWPSHFPNCEDATESNRDLHLLLAGSHFLRDDPRALQVLTALLWLTRWPQSTTRQNPKFNPLSYAVRTAEAALRFRTEKDAQRRVELLEEIDDKRSNAEQIVSRVPARPRKERRELLVSICSLATPVIADRYDRGDHWCRIPVNDLAALHETSRDSVRRALVDAARYGLIERRVECHVRDDRPRKDSLVQLLV